MNLIQNYFSNLVNQSLAQHGGDYARAQRAVGKIHPDLSVLAAACGRTDASVRFVNSRLNGQRQTMNASKRAEFQEAVRVEMERSGSPYDVVFNRVSKSRGQFANSEALETIRAAAAGSGGVPTLTPPLAKLFLLPSDVTPEQWRKVWESNNSQATTINYGKCFNALCELLQGGNGAAGIEDAIAKAKVQFPELWAACQELARLSF